MTGLPSVIARQGQDVLQRLLDRVATLETQERATSPLKGSTTWNPGSIANGSSSSTTCPCPGAVVGDVAYASFDQMPDGDWMISAHVAVNDQVRVVVYNRSGGALDMPNGTVKVRVFQ